MKDEVKNLTPRQWDLYNFLKKQYADGVYISKAQICEALPEHYQMKKTTRLCRDIEYDIRAINECPIIQKIVVSNSKGYKIGNKEEITEYLNTRFRRDLKSLKLSWALADKCALDGQMRLAFAGERDIIEAYPH